MHVAELLVINFNTKEIDSAGIFPFNSISHISNNISNLIAFFQNCVSSPLSGSMHIDEVEAGFLKIVSRGFIIEIYFWPLMEI